MTSSLDERQKSFENKFKHDEELQFKVQIRTSHLFGLWAAEKIGLSGDDARIYAEQVVEADFEEPGFEDVLRKVAQDFSEKNVTVSDHEMRQVWEEKTSEAAQSIIESNVA